MKVKLRVEIVADVDSDEVNQEVYDNLTFDLLQLLKINNLHHQYDKPQIKSIHIR